MRQRGHFTLKAAGTSTHCMPAAARALSLFHSQGTRHKHNTNVTSLHAPVPMTDETDDTDGTEDEARHGRSCGSSNGVESFT